MYLKLLLTGLLSLCSFAYASEKNEKSLCGLTDDRVPSTKRKVARLVIPGSLHQVCTASLIGKSCMISAGHCTKSMGVAQFNLNSSGLSAPTDTYTVNRRTLIYSNNIQGNDYDVFKVDRNAKTGRWPGEVQGSYKVKFTPPATRSILSIAGYGQAHDPKKNFLQQTHSGQVVDIYKGIISYTVDTENGNSGSGLVLEQTGEILGVHTTGGCNGYGGSNGGTLISGNTKFAQAIRNCLASE